MRILALVDDRADTGSTARTLISAADYASPVPAARALILATEYVRSQEDEAATSEGTCLRSVEPALNVCLMTLVACKVVLSADKLVLACDCFPPCVLVCLRVCVALALMLADG
jgi:hypothetical protein